MPSIFHLAAQPRVDERRRHVRILGGRRPLFLGRHSAVGIPLKFEKAVDAPDKGPLFRLSAPFVFF